MADNEVSKTSAWNNPDFRPDLAFAKLTEEMVERMGSYGREEIFPANVPLFTHGERQVDMFVVLDGQVDISVPIANGESKVIAHHQRLDFSGELNLLTSQGSLVEARTVRESHLLRTEQRLFPGWLYEILCADQHKISSVHSAPSGSFETGRPMSRLWVPSAPPQP
jgi:hypothetical protein